MDIQAVILLSIALGIATLLLLVHIRQARRLEKELMRTVPMQTTLQACEQLFLSLYKIAQDAIFVIDAKTGLLLDANRSAQELLGYTLDELRQLHHTDLYPPEGGTDALTAFQESLAGNGTMLHQDLVLHKLGHSIPVEITTSAQVDIAGAQMVVAIFRDISQRRDTEAALRHSEALLRQVIDLVPHHIFAKDRQGRYFLANRAVAQAYGTTVEELLGKTDADFDSDPAEVASYISEDLQVIENGQPKDIPEQHFTPINGSLHLLHTTKIPMTLPDTNERAVLGVSTDITEHRQGELLQNVLYEVAEAVHTAPDMASLFHSIHTSLGKLMDVHNFFVALRVPGYENLFSFPYAVDEHDTFAEVEDLSGSLIAYVAKTGAPALITPERHEQLMQSGLALMIGVPSAIWLGVPLKLGDAVIGVIALQSYIDPQCYTEKHLELMGFVSGQIALATERKRAQTERERLIAELAAKNIELEQFAYSVSHDLKSPLITIRSFVGLLERDVLVREVDRINADIQRINDATLKMERLLNELLELSRIGRTTSPTEVVPFQEIVDEAIELAHGRISERGVQVEVADDLPAVCGDRARLVEVVLNLVDNAVKFMGDQPQPHLEIGVHPEPDDGHVTLFVRDNGSGINPEFQKGVFGMFSKIDPKSEGNGVGLALVKRIIEVHGGKVWVESEGESCGSAFYFSLPRAA